MSDLYINLSKQNLKYYGTDLISKKINKISSASFKLGEIMDAFSSIQLMT